jgi:hypothetical protein
MWLDVISWRVVPNQRWRLRRARERANLTQPPSQASLYIQSNRAEDSPQANGKLRKRDCGMQGLSSSLLEGLFMTSPVRHRFDREWMVVNCTTGAVLTQVRPNPGGEKWFWGAVFNVGGFGLEFFSPKVVSPRRRRYKVR